MGNPFDKLKLAMEGKPQKDDKKKKPDTATVVTGAPAKQSTERSKDPKIQAEIEKRMAAQRKAELEALKLKPGKNK